MDNESKGSVFLLAKQNLRRHRNIVYISFLVFLIMGYTLFFTSKTWYWNDGDLVKATPFNSPMSVAGREVILTRWEYSPEENLMEVELNISNQSTDGIEKYNYFAMERRKGMLKIESIVSDSNFVVLRILNVPKNWKEISLQMQVSQNDVLKFYTNKNSIAMVDSIEDLSKDEYIYRSIENNILYYNDMIKTKKKSIKNLKEKIEIAENHIEQYQTDKVYQTEEERSSTDTKIGNLNLEIENFKSSIETEQDDISEFQKRIRNLCLKQENYK